MILHARCCNVQSKQNAEYSVWFEVVEVRGALLTVRELDMQHIFTTNYDSVRRSTIARATVAPLTAAHDIQYPNVLPVVLHYSVNLVAPTLTSPNANPIPIASLAAPPQSGIQAAVQNPVPIPARRYVPKISDLLDLSPLPQFGLPAVLPQQPIRKPAAKRRLRRNVRAIGPQPMIFNAKNTQVAGPPLLVNLRISMPFLPILLAKPSRTQVPFS